MPRARIIPWSNRNPCSDVCPRLEYETERGITKNPILMARPGSFVFRASFDYLESLRISACSIDASISKKQRAANGAFRVTTWQIFVSRVELQIGESFCFNKNRSKCFVFLNSRHARMRMLQASDLHRRYTNAI